MITRVLIMAGGTGGHVFPALAVAEYLRAKGVEVLWMGTRNGLEADVVSRAGFAIAWINVSGLRGKGLLRWLFAPLRLSQALFQALIILMRFRPMVVLGMGGFVSGPGGLMAWLLKRPLIIHEQNAVAGLTNRLLARLAGRVLLGFPLALPAKFNPLMIGNPVRKNIAMLEVPEKRYCKRRDGLRLLVLGGSLGARALNEVVPQMLTLLAGTLTLQVWHQSGQRNLHAAQQAYANCGVTVTTDVEQGESKLSKDAVKLVPFIEDMAAAYAWADLVLCRAGALTIAELAAAGVAAILVPYPYAVDDHQTRNADWLVHAGAAVQMPQSQLTAQSLFDQLNAMWRMHVNGGDDAVMKERQQLLLMAKKARLMARADATEQLAQACMEAAHAG